jgi:hypothetical protein
MDDDDWIRTWTLVRGNEAHRPNKYAPAGRHHSRRSPCRWKSSSPSSASASWPAAAALKETKENLHGAVKSVDRRQPASASCVSHHAALPDLRNKRRAKEVDRTVWTKGKEKDIGAGDVDHWILYSTSRPSMPCFLVCYFTTIDVHGDNFEERGGGAKLDLPPLAINVSGFGGAGDCCSSHRSPSPWKNMREWRGRSRWFRLNQMNRPRQSHHVPDT